MRGEDLNGGELRNLGSAERSFFFSFKRREEGAAAKATRDAPRDRGEPCADCCAGLLTGGVKAAGMVFMGPSANWRGKGGEGLGVGAAEGGNAAARAGEKSELSFKTERSREGGDLFGERGGGGGGQKRRGAPPPNPITSS